MILVEPFGGMAALSLHAFGLRPPCSRIGNKTGYAHAIAAHLDLEDVTQSAVFDADPALAGAMAALLERPGKLAGEILNHEDVRDLGFTSEELWRACRDVRASDPASWWVWCAGAHGGVGGFKGGHVRRPSVDGFIPRLSNLASRVGAFAGAKFCVSYAVRDAWDVRGAMTGLVSDDEVVVYLDPPYPNATGYGTGEAPSVSELVDLAEQYVAAGDDVRVGISWPEPFLPSASWVAYDVTNTRKGQTRKTLTRTTSEWLMIRDPMFEERSPDAGS